MEEIKVMAKPEWVSWDAIHELLLAAHKKNIKKGIVKDNTIPEGTDLEKKLGDKGKCFVAFCGDKLIGTATITFLTGKKWFNKDKLVAYSRWSGILPKYQGLGIQDDINVLRDKYIIECGSDIIEASTAENNKTVRLKTARDGYINVAYSTSASSGHYSVVTVKWLNGCPYSKLYCKLRFLMSKYYIKMRYKPGGKKRLI